MSILAIDWGTNGCICVDGVPSGDKLKVRKCFEFEWPETARPRDSVDAAGKFLAEELKRQGVSTSTVMVAVPREQGTVRQLQLPNVPDNELPEIVRMQAATRSTVGVDQFLLDYMPLPQAEEAEAREVLMATIPTDISGRIKGVVQVAQLELKTIGLSSAATATVAAIVEQSNGFDPGQLALLIVNSGERLELTVIRHRHVIASHASHVDAGNGHWTMLAEINRMRMSLEGELAGAPLSRVWVAGSEKHTADFRKTIEERVGGSVEQLSLVGVIDPVKLGGKRCGEIADESQPLLLGPLGLLANTQRPLVETVDFLNPRKPIVKKGQSTAVCGTGGGCCATAVPGFHVPQRQKHGRASRTNRVQEE